MTREKIVKSIRDRFNGKIKNVFEKSSKRVYIEVGDKKDLPEVAGHVFKELQARFSIATAVDHPKDIEIMYHFSFDRLGLIVTLRIYASKDDCAVESLTPLMGGAGWIEREMHELFGIEFKNHPNMKSLLLPDDWPKDKYPLRKDFKLNTDKKEPWK